MRILLLAAVLAVPGAAQDAEEKPAAAEATAVEETAPALGSVEALSEPAEKPAEKIEVVEPAPPPAAAPKPAAKASVKAKALSLSELAAAEWVFLKHEGEEARDEASARAALEPLDRLLRARPEAGFADEAQALRAELLMKLSDARGAMLALLKLLYEHPDSKLAPQAKRRFNEIVEKKMERKLRPVLLDIARGQDSASASARTAHMLSCLVQQTSNALYAPLVAEFEEFFARYPEYEGSDELLLQLGQLHVSEERYRDALVAYGKILAMYPASETRAKALRMTGGIWDQHLKDYSRAVHAYQGVTIDYAQSEEASGAYEAMAKLEERMKRHDLAVDIYEKMVKLYPSTDAALRALNEQARLYYERLDRPGQAIQAHERVADMFKETPVAAKALRSAAQLARKQKDYSTQLRLLERLAKDCAETPDAPEAIYEAAELCEDKLADPDRAVELYKQLAQRYPSHKLAKKSNGRVAALNKKAGEVED